MVAIQQMLIWYTSFACLTTSWIDTVAADDLWGAILLDTTEARHMYEACSSEEACRMQWYGNVAVNRYIHRHVTRHAKQTHGHTGSHL